MCGLVGIYSRSDPVAGEVLEWALAALAHRGPDHRRHWIAPDGCAAVGHARLSIIDLAIGHQPIANEDGSLRIAVNGELYDDEQVRARLVRRGHTFRTRSDSEIALHLYEEQGAQCLAHLRGEFALILWDGRNRRLLAARDRFGIKPLFYAEADGKLLVASEVKALFAAGVPARWDTEAYLAYVHAGLLLPHRTFFAGVFQVPPGHYLIATAGQTQLVRYWDFDFPTRGGEPEAAVADEMVTRFRSLLTEAVRLRLRADVPVGIYLSGGLDSSAVLALAATVHSRPLPAFTIAFDDPPYDESEWAAAVADRTGAVLTPVPVAHRDLAEHWADAVWHCETAMVNGHGVAKYLLSRRVRAAGVKVVLTGEGADEVLGGYAHFLADLDQPAAGAHGLPEGHPAGPALAAAARRLGAVPHWMVGGALMGLQTAAFLAAPFRPGPGAEPAFQLFLDGLDITGQVQGRHPLHRSIYLWAKASLPNYILSVLGDRMEMAHSVEGRLPFLDHRLVEFLTRLPAAAMIRGGTQKYILREALRPLLPDRIRARPKHPLTAPPLSVAAGSRFRELADDLLRGPGPLPFYDKGRVAALLDRLPHLPDEERSQMDAVLTGILSTCVLGNRFGLDSPV